MLSVTKNVALTKASGGIFMTMLIAGGHIEVPHYTAPALPTVTSAVCRCGAVYDYGAIVVPSEYRGLCGRCTARLFRRLPAPR